MKYVFLFSLVLAGFSLQAQKININLDQFNQQRLDDTRKSMYVLAGWSAANMVSGAIGMATASGSAQKFHEMNLGWCLVNGILAGSSLLRFKKEKTAGLSLGQSLREQQKLERIFLVNAGLDLAYLGAGAWMLQKSKNGAKKETFQGFGQSLLLQGGFLLVFDAVNAAVRIRHGKLLNSYIDNVQLAAGANGFGLQVALK